MPWPPSEKRTLDLPHPFQALRHSALLRQFHLFINFMHIIKDAA